MSDALSEPPAFIPEWFKRGALQRGGSESTSDQNKQRGGKLLAVADPARNSALEAWQPRGSSSSGASNNYGRTADFGRGNGPPERQPSADRSWKQHDSSSNAGSSRYGAGPKGSAPADWERPEAVSKSFGGLGGQQRNFYGWHESEGGGAPSGRLPDRDREQWPQPRPGRDHADDWPPQHRELRSASSATQPTSGKVTFEREFPSLLGRDAKALAQPASPPPNSGTNTVAPYKQEFLSARANANWTSKLAEAPVLPPAPAPQLPVVPEHAFAGSTPAAQQLPAAHAGPAPVAVPPKPAGVWGSGGASSAAVGAGSSMDAASNNGNVVGPGSSANGSAGVAAASSKARLELLAVKQSKQLVPVLSTGGANKLRKALASGPAAGSATTALGASKAAGTAGAGAPSAQTPLGVMKMPAAKKASDADVAAAGPRVLTSGSTMTLAKRLPQPLDKPLALTRMPPSMPHAPVPAALLPDGVAPGSAAATSSVAPAPMPAAAKPEAREPGESSLPAGQAPEPPPAAAAPASATSAEQRRLPPGFAAPATATQPPAPQPYAPQQQQGVQDGASQEPEPAPIKFQVSAEEEAFLRSLGWTEGDDEEEEEAMLTEEEIAAFKAKQVSLPQQQQPQQQALVAAGKANAASGGIAIAQRAAPQRRPLVVAASYGSHLSTTDSDSECE